MKMRLLTFLLEFPILSWLVGGVNINLYIFLCYCAPAVASRLRSRWSLRDPDAPACLSFAPFPSHSKDIRSLGDLKLAPRVREVCVCIPACARWLQQPPRPRPEVNMMVGQRGERRLTSDFNTKLSSCSIIFDFLFFLCSVKNSSYL